MVDKDWGVSTCWRVEARCRGRVFPPARLLGSVTVDLDVGLLARLLPVGTPGHPRLQLVECDLGLPRRPVAGRRRLSWAAEKVDHHVVSEDVPKGADEPLGETVAHEEVELGEHTLLPGVMSLPYGHRKSQKPVVPRLVFHEQLV